MPVFLSAQPLVWTGQDAAKNAQNNQFQQEGNWMGGVDAGGGMSQVFVFGKADYYQPVVGNNQGRFHRVMSLTFNEDAGRYRFTGEPLIYGDGSFIANNSRFQQEFANMLRFAAEEKRGDITFGIDTGPSGILWSGGSSKENIDRVHITKTGKSALKLEGVYDGIHAVRILQGELVVDGKTKVSFPFQGGVLRVMGANAGAAEVSPFRELTLHSARAAQIILEPEAGKPLTLVVDDWVGNYGMVGVIPQQYSATLHFDLSAKGSQARFKVVGAGGAVTGADGVVPFATVTDATGVTGFVSLKRETPEQEWVVTRAMPEHELPTTVEKWSPALHYHVTLSEETPEHKLVSAEPTGAGEAMAAQWPTLTLRGQGALVLENNHLRAPNILLEEGKGDFVISGSGIAHHGGGYVHATYAMRIFTYRDASDGALIISTDHFGHVTKEGDVSPAKVMLFDITHASLTKTGPGTLVFRSPNTNIIGGLYVQQGRMQIESSGFKVTTDVSVLEGGILAGNGQIGGGDRWVRDGGTIALSGIRYTPVTIDFGGILDTTPSRQDKQSDMRALSIFGSLSMNKDAVLTMGLNKDVVGGKYTPLQVNTDKPNGYPTVVLAGNLQLEQLENISAEKEIILLKTNGYTNGMFDSINGAPIDMKDQAVIQYNGATYTVSLDYSRDLGDKQTGVVVRITP